MRTTENHFQNMLGVPKTDYKLWHEEHLFCYIMLVLNIWKCISTPRVPKFDLDNMS